MNYLRILAVLGYILVSAMPGSTPVNAVSPCGSYYTVVSGDTLIEIAVRCNVSLTAILDANPQIIDPDQIYPGWTIKIPTGFPAQIVQPALAISPACGPPGTSITISAVNLPRRTPVGIGFGTKDAPYDIVDTISTGTLGSIRTQVVVPPTSLAGDEWEVILLTLKGRPVLQLVSTPFVVTTRGSPSAVAGSCKPIPSQTDFTHYRVRTGDSLDSIAGQLGLSTASLLAINPLITNPDQVRIDQELVVPAPGHGALAILSPDNGPPGTAATLEGLGFPTNTSLALGLGLWRFDYKPVGVVSTNAIGWFSTPITIPLSAKENQRWAMRITPGSPEAASLDNEPVISNPFTIKQTIPVDQPVVTIYPQSGPPGTSLTVVGAGFPRDSKIILAVGQDEIRAEPVDTSYAGINGTFQSEVTIPTYAASGEAWIVSASTTITVGKVVTDYLAISLPFTITQSKP